MIDRIAQPRQTRGLPSFDLGVLPRAGRRALAWRPPRGDELKLFLYRLAWSPYWAGSDIPAPHFRVNERAFPQGGPAGDRFAQELDRLVNRVWLQRALTILARSLWLPLLAACLWLGLELAGGPGWNPWTTVWIGAALLPPALLFAWLAKPSRRAMARSLDRSFMLQERMLTALEDVGRDVMAPGASPSVPYLQIADAANIIIELRNHPVFRPRIPVRECVLALFFALLLASLYFMRGVGGGIPPLSTDPVPAFVPAADRLAEETRAATQPVSPAASALTPEEVEAMAQRSNEAQQDLKKLGEALSDQAVTRAAAEAIQRGDYEAAADLIREAGERAESLSESARNGLANDLDAAADQMSPGGEALADSARVAADGLREGGEAAQEGMESLGDAVDSTADDVVSQQQLAEEMSRAQAAEASSGGEAGDPSRGDQSAGGSGEQGGSESSAGGSDGADAQPGAEQGDEESTGGSETEGGTDAGSQGDQSAGEQGGNAGEEAGGGQGTEGAEPGEAGQPGEAAQNGDAQSVAGDQLGEGGQPGAGAGAGPEEVESDGDSGSQGDSSDQEPSGEASDPNVSDGNSAGDAAGAEEDPRTAVTLSRAPEGESIQTGSTGSSSAGSGTGGAGGAGTTVQGEVGEAGPDSNHVPPEYRSLVEAYFSDGDE